MNKKLILYQSLVICFTIGVIFTQSADVLADTTVIKVTSQDVIASIRAGNLDVFDRTMENWQSRRQQFCGQLLEIFNNTKSSRQDKCAAAYCLGELRASEAVNSLADNITLNLGPGIIDHISPLEHTPVADALVKIGIPSIPAVIRNLEESDNSYVRALSLTVLYRIEGDKDIVQLRLRKALSVQSDSTKKSRLQSALKSFATM